MKSIRSGWILFGLPIALLAWLLTLPAWAQYPDRPIKLVIPYPPGGLTDLMARTLQQPLSELLGQAVVIENRGGAAGGIGARQVAQSKPDGYTLLLTNNGPSALLPLIQAEPGYNPVKDFAPVSLIMTAPLALVISGTVPAKDLKDFIEYGRQQKGGVEFATAGVGSLGHLTSELFSQKTGIPMVHVPYSGSSPAVAALLSGDVKMYLSSWSDTLAGSVKSGKLRLLGVSTKEPSPVLPGTPPIATVLPDFNVLLWHGIVAPAGTPEPILLKLNQALRKVLAMPEVEQRFLSFGCVATSTTPAEMGEMIAAEVPMWQAIIKTSGIKPQ